MASATVIKFPDGRTESKNILSSFERNATNVVLFETDKVDNGHKVVEVSYLEDGMYRNVIDSNKWSEIKQDLVDILHDRIQNEEYRIVPAEVLVTEDPYRQLALRDENYEKIATSYANYVNTMVNDTVVKEEAPVENPAEELTSQIDEMVKTVDANVPAEASLNGLVPETVNESVETSVMEQGDAPVLVSETPKEIVPEISPMPEIIQSELKEEAHEDIPQTEVINPFGSFVPEASTEEVVADTVASQDMVNDVPVLVSETPKEAVSGIASMPEMIQPESSDFAVAPGPMMAPVGIVDAPIAIGVDDFINVSGGTEEIGKTEDSILDIPQPSFISETISQDKKKDASILDIQPAVMPVPGTINDFAPAAEQVSKVPKTVESAIDTTYINSVDGVIAEMRKKTEEYTNTIQKLQESYINEMELMKNEISNKLQEARGINELSKQTFDKAQAMNNVEMMNSGMELKRVA